jgi:nitrogen fixation protein FixH
MLLPVAGCSKKPPAPSITASGESVSGWTLALSVVPDRPRMVRPATFTVHVTDAAGMPVENALVVGSMNMTLMDMGKTELKFESTAHGEYKATVKSFDMSGPWELAVEASRAPDRSGKKFAFVVGE